MVAPVPALPDTERRTPYLGLTDDQGPFAVGFDLYGSGIDYGNWIEVWLDDALLTAGVDYTLSSDTGSLGVLARPITDAEIVPAGSYAVDGFTGDLVIYGAERPRRLAVFTENMPVPARSLNQAFNAMSARQRELWDRLNRVLAESQLPTIEPRASAIVNDSGAPGATVAEGLEGLDARATSLENDLDALSDQIGGIGALSSFAKVADVQATALDDNVLYLRTAGYSAAGDSGGALYKRAVSEPSHQGKIQSQDGAWWEIAEHIVTAAMFNGSVANAAAYIATRTTDKVFSSAAATLSGRQIRNPSPVHDLASGVLSVYELITGDVQSHIIAANKQHDHHRISWTDGEPLKYSVDDGGVVKGYSSNVQSESDSHLNSNVYGGTNTGKNAGPGTVKGGHSAAIALTGSTGPVVGQVGEIAVEATSNIGSAGLQSTVIGADDIGSYILPGGDGARVLYGYGSTITALAYRYAVLDCWFHADSHADAYAVRVRSAAGTVLGGITKNNDAVFNSLKLTDSSAGGYVLQQSPNLGDTPTITWGNQNGTPAVVATAPLSISSAGTIALGKRFGDCIFSQVFSNQATCDVTGIFNDTYDSYLVEITAAKPATDDVTAQLLVGTGVGPTYQTSGYEYGLLGVNRGGAAATLSANAAAAIPLSIAGGSGDGCGNNTGEHLNARIELANPDAGDYVHLNVHTARYNRASDGTVNRYSGVAQYSTAGAITGLRFKFSAGNASCVIRVYGFGKSAT